MLIFFESLFNAAKDEDEIQFFTSFFPFYVQFRYNIISYTTDYEFLETLELIKQFSIPKDTTGLDYKTQARLMLFLYCHIIEADYVFMVIYNMIRTIIKEEYCAQITIINKRKEIEIIEFSSQKVDLILSKTKELDIGAHATFESLFDFKLRNAFNHSQYFLSEEGDLQVTAYESPSSKKFGKSGKYLYGFMEIKQFYEFSRIYIRSFIKCSEEIIKPYMNGEPHPTLYGPLKYNTDHNWVFEQKS